MIRAQQMVTDFHRAMGQPVGDTSSPSLAEDRTLRLDLISEEFAELEVALHYNDLVEVADALGDLLYVVIGSAVTWGIDIAAVFETIHRSNMTKVDGPKRADGKILKGPGYVPPDIRGALGIK